MSELDEQILRDIFNGNGLNYSQIVGDELTTVSMELQDFNYSLKQVLALIANQVREATEIFVPVKGCSVNRSARAILRSNYNERLDEVLQNLSWKQHELGTKGLIPLSRHEYEAKQSITSLIKELVAEAKPAEKDQLAQSTLDDESRCRFYRYGGYNFAIDQFEQNLLKALEEV